MVRDRHSSEHANDHVDIVVAKVGQHTGSIGRLSRSSSNNIIIIFLLFHHINLSWLRTFVECGSRLLCVCTCHIVYEI